MRTNVSRRALTCSTLELLEEVILNLINYLKTLKIFDLIVLDNMETRVETLTVRTKAKDKRKQVSPTKCISIPSVA